MNLQQEWANSDPVIVLLMACKYRNGTATGRDRVYETIVKDVSENLAIHTDAAKSSKRLIVSAVKNGFINLHINAKKISDFNTEIFECMVDDYHVGNKIASIHLRSR